MPDIKIDTPVGELIGLGRDLIDKIWPDKTAQAAQRAQAEAHVLDLAQQRFATLIAASQSSDAAQVSTNNIEAASPDFWKSGARPAVMWVCVCALFSEFIVRPYAHAFAQVDVPSLDMGTLMGLLFALLGVSTQRTIEKLKGVA